MTYEGLKAFATYFLSQADRGLEKEEVDLIPAYLDGAISKFGVGATQAVSVVTQSLDCVSQCSQLTVSGQQYNQCDGWTNIFLRGARWNWDIY